MDTSPKISVCMATYNGEKYIEEQIDSILLQLKDNDELVISDDGSTDNTLSIINSYNDSRIRLFRHKKKKSNYKYASSQYYTTANFENALREATGDYIFLSDQDDIWLPKKINDSILALKGGLLVTKTIHINNSKNHIGGNRVLKSKYNIFDVCIRAPFSGCTMCMTRDFLSKALPFPKGIIAHDTYLLSIAVKFNKLSILDKQLILYRKHGENVTMNSRNPLWFKIYFRLKYIYHYIILSSSRYK